MFSTECPRRRRMRQGSRQSRALCSDRPTPNLFAHDVNWSADRQKVKPGQSNPPRPELGQSTTDRRTATGIENGSHPPPPSEWCLADPLDVLQAVSFLLARSVSLTEWERQWLVRLRQSATISESDRHILAAIERAVYGPHLPAESTPAVVDGVPGLVHASKVLPNGRSENSRFTRADRLPRELKQLVLERLFGDGRSR
jgi:hypothetical protein